ncbi:Magnesium transporter NIPA [Gracilaria domingensis]|nr:Magnesium transporter NIPA [Gracilaria domingensis]
MQMNVAGVQTLPDLTPMAAPWSIGLLLAMAGYTMCGAGMNLIKLSHIKRGTTNGSTVLRSTPFNRRSSPAHATLLWFCGYGVNSLGGVLNTAGLRFAAQSLIAPLSSMALVVNAVFATFVLGERLGLRDVLPMSLIAVGNIIAVASANHSEQRGLTLIEISQLFRRSSFQLYLVTVLVLASLLMIIRGRIRRRIRKSGGEEMANPTLVAYAGLCHAAAAAMLSVNTVFLSKASLLALTDGLHNAFKPQFLALILTWLSLVCFWIYTLNRLLASHDILFIVPAIEVLWSLCSMIGGGIFFDEYSSMKMSRRVSFAVGVVINLTGVFILSRRGEKGNKLG